MQTYPNKIQVLIVGAGPVGLVLATLLSHANITVMLIDKRESLSLFPRGIAINQATLDIFETLGLTSVFEQGIKIPYVNLYWRNKKLAQLDFNQADTQHPYFFHIEQSKIEGFLQENLQSEHLSFRKSVSFLGLEQTESSVKSRLKDQEGEFLIHSDYVIGCDGGQSTVRENMHSLCQQRSYGAYFVLADVDFEEGITFGETHYYFTPEGYAMIVPISNQRTRIIFSFLGKSDNIHPNNIHQDFFQSILNKRVSIPLVISKIHWSTHANFGHRISEKVYENRVILAGDALHQFSPVGGTNMNVGLQDALSLAWRLVLQCQHGFSGDALIQSYVKERSAVIQKQQEITEWFTALMTRTKQYATKNCQFSLKNANHQLLGFGRPFDGSRHLYEIFSPTERAESDNAIRDCFLKSSFLLIATSKEKFNNSISQFPLCSIYLEKNKKTKHDYYLFRPDGWLAEQGDQRAIEKFINNYLKEL